MNTYILWMMGGERHAAINVDGVLYEHVSKYVFEYIYDDMKSKNIDPYDNYGIGRMDDGKEDEWKYWICGNKETENRFLLKGNRFNAANYPEVYFCREDILELYRESIPEEIDYHPRDLFSPSLKD